MSGWGIFIYSLNLNQLAYPKEYMYLSFFFFYFESYIKRGSKMKSHWNKVIQLMPQPPWRHDMLWEKWSIYHLAYTREPMKLGIQQYKNSIYLVSLLFCYRKFHRCIKVKRIVWWIPHVPIPRDSYYQLMAHLIATLTPSTYHFWSKSKISCHFACKYFCNPIVFKYVILILDLGFLLLPCGHFYKPVVSAVRDVYTFQKEKGIRKVSTSI